MEDEKLGFGIIVDKNTVNMWSLGINLTHWYRETYIYINLFKWTLMVGKFYK